MIHWTYRIVPEYSFHFVDGRLNFTFRELCTTAVICWWRVDLFLELSNNIAIFDGHGGVICLGVVINKDIVRPLSVIALLGEFASGLPLRPRITFYMSCLLLFFMASSSTFFQPLVLSSFISSLLSLQASIHSWGLTSIARSSQLRVRIFVLTWGFILGLAFRLGLVFPT